MRIASEWLVRYWQRFINRADTYCQQLPPPQKYVRRYQPLTESLVERHLLGEMTLAADSLDTVGCSRWLCFDSDASHGLAVLLDVQAALDTVGVTSWREQSRRGGHLWVWFDHPQPAIGLQRLGRWACKFLGIEMEVYPNRSVLSDEVRTAQAMRLPLGVHQLTGERYPFIDASGRPCHPVTAADAVAWLIAQTPNSTHQLQAALLSLPQEQIRAVDHTPLSAAVVPVMVSEDPRAEPYGTAWGIIGWVKQHSIPQVIAWTRPDVALTRAGRGYIGWCPFHDDASPQQDGTPGTPSLYVYRDIRYGWRWKCLSSNCGAAVAPVKDAFDWLVWLTGGQWRKAIEWAMRLQEDTA